MTAHPRGLVTLAGTELWERFSFYGLQVILAYYLYYSLTDGGLGLDVGVAVGVAGSYGGAVYVSQMVGAWIADRLVAARTVVLYSAMLIMLGHLVLALVPAVAGVAVGLILIVAGTGGLKVNVTTMVGMLYSDEDPRRDSGYSLYYMGISLGAFLGPLLTGVLQSSAGFHIAFGAAAVGMLLGVTQYVAGYKNLPDATRTVPNPLPRSRRAPTAAVAGMAIAAIAVAGFTGVLNLDNISAVLTVVIVVASLAYFAMLLTSHKTVGKERQRVVAYIPMFLSSLLFWTLLFQLFTTLAVYMDTRVDLTVGSVTMPAALIITLEGLFATVLAPLYALIWTKLGDRQPSPGTKVVAGIALLAAAMAIFAAMAGTGGPTNSVIIALAVMVLFAAGEIAVVPSVLSATAQLAPQAHKAEMTALYFLTMAGGSTLAGLLAQTYNPAHEFTFFGGTALLAVLAAGVLYGSYRTLMARAH
ncbi:peptide MFS transporter [Rhodococcus sp. NPDC057529]|uniref:peptide MFS transporter n=1 Tax=Rhodococcus sp. NPDC057529 TaxID=3346158 RepID=UPI00366CB157